jgi:hypothetical protein
LRKELKKMKNLLVVIILIAASAFVAMCYADDSNALPPGWAAVQPDDRNQDDSRLDKLIQDKIIPIAPAQVNDWKTESNTMFTPYVGVGASGPAVPEHVIKPTPPKLP